MRYEFKFTTILADGWAVESSRWVVASSREEAVQKFLESVGDISDWWIEGVWSFS